MVRSRREMPRFSRAIFSSRLESQNLQRIGGQSLL
jgi:hypothetical protein